MSDKKQLWIPPSTSKTILFPLSEPSNAFETGSYDPSFSNNQVSLEEINQFIPKINGEYELHKQNLTKQGNKQAPFVILIFLMVIVDIYLVVYSNTDPQSLLSVPEAIILGSLLVLWICLMCGCRLDSVDFVAQMKDRCQDLVDQQNEALKDRGFKWHLPEQFPAWIELTKQMDKQSGLLEIAPSKVEIPRTTETTIILPRQRYKTREASDDTSRFTQDFYLPEMTNERISSEEMQRFLAEINPCLRTPFKPFYKVSFILWMCLSFEYFGIFYIKNHLPHLIDPLLRLLVAVSSLCFCLVVFNREIESEMAKRNLRIKIAMQPIINKYNVTLQNRGLKWRLPDGFLDWIELCKDSNVHSENQALYTRPGHDLEANNLYTPFLRE